MPFDTETATQTRETFRAAYRMARLAFRGEREGLKLDLQSAPDYSPTCRRCNAGVRIVRKVEAAIGSADNFAICLNGQAVMIAFGMPPHRQPGMPCPLDFEGWAEWRAWVAEVRKAA